MTPKRWIPIGLAVVMLAAVVVAAAQNGPPQAKNFVAVLSGDEEVPPVETRARGQSFFQLNEDGDELFFRVIVANIENVNQAHIHGPAPAGANAPPVVWLYPQVEQEAILIPGRFQGILAQGVITADDLVGTLEGATLTDLVDMMRAGLTYVNVHTLQHGPGEVRGQIRPAGPRGP